MFFCCSCETVAESKEDLESHICIEHINWFDRFQCRYCDENDVPYCKPIERLLLDHCAVSHSFEDPNQGIIYDMDREKGSQLKKNLELSLEITKLRSAPNEVATVDRDYSKTPSNHQQTVQNRVYRIPSSTMSAMSIKLEPITVPIAYGYCQSQKDHQILNQREIPHIETLPPQKQNISHEGDSLGNNIAAKLNSKTLDQRQSTISGVPDREKNNKHGYICVKCDKRLRSREDTNRHIKSKHFLQNDNRYQCPNCEYGSKWTKKDVEIHIKRLHAGNGHFIDNKDLFEKRISMLKEQLIVSDNNEKTIGETQSMETNDAIGVDKIIDQSKNSGNGNRKCTKCNRTVKIDQVKDHLFSRQHLNKKLIHCSKCQFTSYNLKVIGLHLKQKHSNARAIDRRDAMMEEYEREKIKYIIPL